MGLLGVGRQVLLDVGYRLGIDGEGNVDDGPRV